MANIGDTSMSYDEIMKYGTKDAVTPSFTIAPDPTKIVSRTPMEIAQDATAQSITQETIAAETVAKEGTSLLTRTKAAKEGWDAATQRQAEDGSAYTPSYGLLEDFEGSPLFTPEAMETFATHYPGANKEFMFGNQIDNTAYMRTKQALLT